MTTNLPNLSTWHSVPAGATIPANTPYAYIYDDDATLRLEGTFVDIVVRQCDYYYTEHPIAPPLPTEEGATILASGGHWPPYILLTREDARWVNHVGDEWREREIRAWVPVALGETVVVRP